MIPEDTKLLIVISTEELKQIVSDSVREEYQKLKQEDLQEEFLSPHSVCQMFKPTISKPTLNSWATKGLLTKHHIGGRTFFKYSEIIQAVEKIKKYKI